MDSTGLRDYDVLARADQTNGKLEICPLSVDFSNKFYEILKARKQFLGILSLGVRGEDQDLLSFILKLEAGQHLIGQGSGHFKRYIFYALLFYHPDIYSCDFKEANFGDESYYGPSEVFEEMCHNFSTTNFHSLQPLCSKHQDCRKSGNLRNLVPIGIPMVLPCGVLVHRLFGPKSYGYFDLPTLVLLKKILGQTWYTQSKLGT